MIYAAFTVAFYSSLVLNTAQMKNIILAKSLNKSSLEINSEGLKRLVKNIEDNAKELEQLKREQAIVRATIKEKSSSSGNIEELKYLSARDIDIGKKIETLSRIQQEYSKLKQKYDNSLKKK
jgi:hypothetical protein